jgi:hypothetical protein
MRRFSGNSIPIVVSDKTNRHTPSVQAPLRGHGATRAIIGGAGRTGRHLVAILALPRLEGQRGSVCQLAAS